MRHWVFNGCPYPIPDHPETETPFSDTRTFSLYVPSSDGTLLAVDVTLPLAPGGAGQAFPALVLANRSCRRDLSDPEIKLGYDLARYGYAFVSFELRGCGASYGVNDRFGSPEHCQDLIAVTRWARAQPWCSGKIGLFGCSNRAYIQLCTAALDPDTIDAITPVVAVPDFYYQNYPNGVSAVPHWKEPGFDHLPSKEEFLHKVVPVDGDPDGSLAYQAFVQDQYGSNRDFFQDLLVENLNRDTAHPGYQQEKVFETLPPMGKLDPFFRRPGVRQHQMIGELESGTLDQLAQFLDHGGSVCLGPWTHGGACTLQSSYHNGTLPLTEVYRQWFDAALKGAPNGFLAMPPVSYYMINAQPGTEWRLAESWPPANESRTTLYLDAAPSGTCHSAWDGSLTLDRPAQSARLSYTVREDLCVFPRPDGTSGYRRTDLCWDGDMTRSVDEKGLTFTTAPLFPFYCNEMAGCITLDLWLSCTAPDVDLVAYAEEVRADGSSHYIKDGVIRASHRTAGQNPAWEKMGAVWHTSRTEDVQRCLAEGLQAPTRLQFAIDPIAYHFQPDSRLRITITCANPAAFQHMYNGQHPVITLYTGGDYCSSVSVPFLDLEYNVYHGTVNDEPQAATLYLFPEHLYLFHADRWQKFPRPERFSVQDHVLFLDADTRFQPAGKPESLPVPPCEALDDPTPYPFPAFKQQHVATVPIESRPYRLFVPGQKDLCLDVFRKEPGGTLPCIVFIHGYGWPYCGFLPQLDRLYRKGYAIAAIDIRNYPPNQFPDYIHDAKGAIRYLRAHAQRFGLDPERFATYGFSLGGNTSLMLGITGDEPGLEGDVGGNTDQSSRVQACAAGFAWADLLHMCGDLEEEFALTPDLQKARVQAMSGAFSPSAEVIGFAAPGEGIGVLLDYLKGGRCPENPRYEEALRKAAAASPINRINPRVPPIALFNGHGDQGVNIAFKQTLRTFEALNKVGAQAFLYGNTHGKYGESEEVMEGIEAFFDHCLRRPKTRHILAIQAGRPEIVCDYVTRPISATPRRTSDGVVLDSAVLRPFLPSGCLPDDGPGPVDLTQLNGPAVQSAFYPDFDTVVLQYGD